MPKDFKPSLNDYLNMLDVAAELKKQEKAVDTQFNIDTFKKNIKAKLLKSSKGTLNPLNDKQADQAVEAYFQGLYTFKKPKKSFGYNLLKVYTKRLIIFKVFFSIIFISLFLFSIPKLKSFYSNYKNNQIEARIENIYLTSKNKINNKNDRYDQEVIRELKNRLNLINTSKTVADAKLAKKDYDDFLKFVNKKIYLKIVNKKGIKSGIDRYFDDYKGQRISGYYLIVQAFDQNNNLLEIEIDNIETGKKMKVDTWGEMVPLEVYNKVRADKINNGIINNNILAIKDYQKMDFDFIMIGDNFDRRGQITKW